MTDNIYGPDRQSIRLQKYDYASEGAYYVTICAQGRLKIFGDVIDGQIKLSAIGEMIQRAWKNIPAYGEGIALDEFIVMPDHLHGIILIGLYGGQARRPALTMTRGIRSQISIPNIIQRFKSWTTHQFQMDIRRQGAEPLHRRLWQRNYYEHIIRDDDDLNRI